MELTHPEIQELLGAYALDAVEPDEAEAVEVHLRDCPRCRSEVEEHREVAASLALAGSTAPAGLWSRIAASLEEEAPQLDMASVVSLPAGAWSAEEGEPSGGTGRSGTPGRSVRSAARRRWSTRLMVGVAAAAAAVIALLGILGAEVARQDNRIEDLAAALQGQGIDQAVQAALFDQRARRVELTSADGHTFAQAVVRENGEGYLVRHNLPALPDDRTYQVWAILGDRPVSVGVLGAKPGAAAFRMEPAGVSVLAVTAEAAGGAAAPTSDPVVRGFLPVT